MTWIGCSFIDDYGDEQIYWLTYEMIHDGDTGATDDVPLNQEWFHSPALPRAGRSLEPSLPLRAEGVVGRLLGVEGPLPGAEVREACQPVDVRNLHACIR